MRGRIPLLAIPFATVSSPPDNAALRHESDTHGLRRADLDPDPIKHFGKWFDEATAANIRDVNAMSLATSTADGIPFVRIVLLKAISERGFVFLTNYQSDKGNKSKKPARGTEYFLGATQRQNRISGGVEKTSRKSKLVPFATMAASSARGPRNRAVIAAGNCWKRAWRK